MLENYLPVIMQAMIALGFAGVMLLMSLLLGKKGKANPTKESPYECGMKPIGDGAPPVSYTHLTLPTKA